MKEKDNGAGDTIFFNLYLIDKFGNAGYRNIFIYAAVVMVIGVINAVVTQIYKKKKLVQEV